MSGKMILRVMPVETTCFASVEEIKEAAAPIIAREFPKGDQVTSTRAKETDNSEVDETQWR